MTDKIIKQKIISHIKTSNHLTTSLRILVDELLNEFEHQLLYETLADYMDNSSINRRQWIVCIRTLCKINRVEANKKFVHVLQTEADIDKRARVLILLKDCGEKLIVPTIIELLKDETDPDLKFLMVFALGNIGDERALSILKKIAQNDIDENYEGEKISDLAERMLILIHELNK